MPENTIQLNVRVAGGPAAAAELRNLEAAATRAASTPAAVSVSGAGAMGLRGRVEQAFMQRQSAAAVEARTVNSLRGLLGSSGAASAEAKPSFDIRNTTEFAEAQQRLALGIGATGRAAAQSSDDVRRLVQVSARMAGFGEYAERVGGLAAKFGDLGLGALKAGGVLASFYAGWKIGTFIADVSGLRKEFDQLAGAMEQLPEYNRSARKASQYEAARNKWEGEHGGPQGFNAAWRQQSGAVANRQAMAANGDQIRSAVLKSVLDQLAKGRNVDAADILNSGATPEQIVKARLERPGAKALPEEPKAAGRVYADMLATERERLDQLRADAARTPGTPEYRKAQKETTERLYTEGEKGRQADESKTQLDATIGKAILGGFERARRASDSAAERVDRARVAADSAARNLEDPAAAAARKSALAQEAIDLQAQRRQLADANQRKPSATSEAKLAAVEKRIATNESAMLALARQEAVGAQARRGRQARASAALDAAEIGDQQAKADERLAEAKKAAYERWRAKEQDVREFEAANIAAASTSQEALAELHHKLAADRARNEAEWTRDQVTAARAYAADQRAIAEARRRAANEARLGGLRNQEAGARGQLALVDRARGAAAANAARAADRVARDEAAIQKMGVRAGNERVNFLALAANTPEARKARKARQQELKDQDRVRDITDRLAAGDDPRRMRLNKHDRELLLKENDRRIKLREDDKKKKAADDALINLDKNAAKLQQSIDALTAAINNFGMAP